MDKQNWLDTNKFIDYQIQVKHINPDTASRYKSYVKNLLYWAGDMSLADAESIEPDLISYLSSQYSQRTRAPFARETWRKTLGLTSSFFGWAKQELSKKYRAVSPRWIDSLVIPKHVKQIDNRDYVTLETILAFKKLGLDNRNNLPIFRDAVAAVFLFLSGMRASAFISLPILAVNLSRLEIRQDPSLGVRTKFGKSGLTYLLPLQDLIKFVSDWDKFVRAELPPTACWYAPLRNQWGEISLTQNEPGLRRGQTLNKRLRKLFNMVGLPYQSAHKFRHAHAHWGIEHCKSIGEYKVLSQNLMHESILITDQIYGGFNDEDRRRTMRSLGG